MTETTSDLAPVALFAFNRPEHTRAALAALAANELADQTHLYIFCDGPRDDSQAEGVAAVRKVVREQAWCGRVEIVEREQNQGLARSIIDGASRLCRDYGRVIVIEDDLISSPQLLRFMNRCLARYADDPSVYQVSGYMYDVPELAARREVFLLPLVTSWGWATWERAWSQFDPLAEGWKETERDKALKRRFDLDGAQDYSDMLRRQQAGEIDSWAIRWYWTVFRRGGLAAFPPTSLIENTGFDGSGTHGSRSIRQKPQPPVVAFRVEDLALPDAASASEDWKAVKDAIRRMRSAWVVWLKRLLRKLG